jgi:hypothetical protein
MYYMDCRPKMAIFGVLPVPIDDAGARSAQTSCPQVVFAGNFLKQLIPVWAAHQRGSWTIQLCSRRGQIRRRDCR